ncbi:hypothetical protein [Pseudonocardia pini]|uniref:hypothetical protein n=1 Tax=Pseudonocardia pini TaxID=2758030 RepID=UPI0015EFDE99|nr:hypothetical protein [Pseudonocardia pini]
MHERDLYALHREQRDYVTAAARQLRHIAAQDDLARRGTHPEHAYGLASLLDLLALDWAARRPAVRERTLDVAEGILGAVTTAETEPITPA